MLSHINGRRLPDEDILARVVDNAVLLVERLAFGDLSRRATQPFPTLDLEP